MGVGGEGAAEELRLRESGKEQAGEFVYVYDYIYERFVNVKVKVNGD